MHIVVCVKTVPNPALPAEFDADRGIFVKDNWNYVLNPHDEIALEQAVRLKEKYGGTISVITADSERSTEILKKCLALGADKAVRVEPGGLTLDDSLTIAKMLHRVINQMPYDLIICGDRSDRNCGEVGVMLAELLGLPAVTAITGLEISGDFGSAVVYKKLEKGAREKKRCPLPALFTADMMLCEPGYPTLPGRLKAQQKDIEVIIVGTSQSEPDRLLPDKHYTRLISVNRPPPKKIFIPAGNLSPAERIRQLTQRTAVKSSSGNILEGNPEEIAIKVVGFLKEKRLLPE